MSFIVITIFLALIWIAFVTNRIPKTGRDPSASGEVITAVITNANRTSDRAAVLHAQKDGRHFKVKMKPTEAHLWIKGDEINIILSKNKKTYRVLFCDYFRENEPRLRERALDLLGKINENFVAARAVKYTKEQYDRIKNSSMDSRNIFALASYMRMIDIYSIVVAIAAVAVVVFKYIAHPKSSSLFIATVIILLILWILYSCVLNCRKILKRINK